MDAFKALDLASGCNSVKGRYQACYSGDIMTTYRITVTDWNDDVGRVVAQSYKKIIDSWYDVVTDGFGLLHDGAEQVAKAYNRIKEINTEYARAIADLEKISAELK